METMVSVFVCKSNGVKVLQQVFWFSTKESRRTLVRKATGRGIGSRVWLKDFENRLGARQ